MNRITADERKVLIQNAITRMKDGEIVERCTGPQTREYLLELLNV